jgi:hypothetical protein
LVPWERIVTWRGGVATSAGGEVAPGREKGGHDVSWDDTNLSRMKHKENPRDQFGFYK